MTSRLAPGMIALGNNKGPLYAAARRIESILDEAVISGALDPAERRLVRLYVQEPPSGVLMTSEDLPSTVYPVADHSAPSLVIESPQRRGHFVADPSNSYSAVWIEEATRRRPLTIAGESKLDVERLARAIAAVPPPGPPISGPMEDAQAIAVQYDHLGHDRYSEGCPECEAMLSEYPDTVR